MALRSIFGLIQLFISIFMKSIAIVFIRCDKMQEKGFCVTLNKQLLTHEMVS